MTRAEILAAAQRRMEMGRHKYGEFDPATDPRDMIAELEAELLDAINYAVMAIQKLRYASTVSGQRITVEHGRLVVRLPKIG